jgi:hypothetical protein
MTRTEAEFGNSKQHHIFRIVQAMDDHADYMAWVAQAMICGSNYAVYELEKESI